MFAILCVLAFLGLGLVIFVNQPQFGRLPSGDILERVKASPNYREGGFANREATPMFAPEVNQFELYWQFFFKKGRQTPLAALPAQKTDLKNLDPGRDALVWLGHSSFFLQLHGKRFLLDPVLSPNASPFFFTTKAFTGTDVYRPQDMPDIDYLLISHDHWDHLDYRTLTALKGRLGKVVCGLGVAAHLRRWGFADEAIIEGDWDDVRQLAPDLTLHFATARHFSGRDLRGQRTLWVSYVLESPERRLYFSGDSGYGRHFADLGSRFGGFDLVLLDSGQYDWRWPNLHMTPHESAQAAVDLGAKALMPMHAGKFCISNHDWDEPFAQAVAAAREKDLPLLTPLIGEAVFLDDLQRPFSAWWQGLE